MRLAERNSEREVEQALKASFVKKDQKHSWSEAKKKHGRSQKSETSTFDEKKYHKGWEKFDNECLMLLLQEVWPLCYRLLVKQGKEIRRSKYRKKEILMMNMCY